MGAVPVYLIQMRNLWLRVGKPQTKPTQLLSGGAGPPIRESASGQLLLQCLALQPKVPFIGGNEGGSGHPGRKRKSRIAKRKNGLPTCRGT